MPSSSKYLQLLREAQSIQPNTFPESFPFSEFQSNLAKYNEQDGWYNGTALDQTMSIAGEEVKLYPVRINPIKGTCQRHVGMLFGDIRHDDRLLVTPRVVKTASMSDEEKKQRELFEEILATIWYENNGRDIQLNNGMMSQRYGGCVFYVKYSPFSGHKYPITIEAPNPKFFIGIPNSSNPFDLEESWIVKPISQIEIQAQGIVSLSKNAFGVRQEFGDDVHWLCEHYTKKNFECFIDESRVGRNVSLTKGTSVVPIGAENKTGIVPIVYIPHIRDTGNFYGDNVFDSVIGIVRELNARVADMGDAMSMDSHDIVVTKNINGAPTVTQLLPGITRVDLGSGVNITGGEAQPDATSLRTSSLSQGTMDALLNSVLYKQYRRDAIHPAVCDGEDEGSQRSSQTLITRMWALETHINMERISWVSGLNVLEKIIGKTLAAYAPEIGITEEHAGFRVRHVWFPTLKKDSNDLITEVSTRYGAGLSSLETSIEMIGDVEDVETEIEKIMAEKKELAEIAAKANPPFGGTPPNKETSSKSKPVKKENVK